mgnify:CR=1 FL=1
MNYPLAWATVIFCIGSGVMMLFRGRWMRDRNAKPGDFLSEFVFHPSYLPSLRLGGVIFLIFGAVLLAKLLESLLPAP